MIACWVWILLCRNRLVVVVLCNLDAFLGSGSDCFVTYAAKDTKCSSRINARVPGCAGNYVAVVAPVGQSMITAQTRGNSGVDFSPKSVGAMVNCFSRISRITSGGLFLDGSLVCAMAMNA